MVTNNKSENLYMFCYVSYVQLLKPYISFMFKAPKSRVLVESMLHVLLVTKDILSNSPGVV